MTKYENVLESFLGISDLDVRLIVKSKLRLNSCRDRKRSLNVQSSFSGKHVLWRDRSKQICIHDVIERQLPWKVAHYLSICGKNNDCDMNDAQLDCAPNTTHFFPNSNLKQTVSGFSISDVVRSFGINYVSKKQTRSNYTISSF